MNRKSFLKLAASGGVSAVFGLAGGLPRFWNEAGVRLIKVQRQTLVMGSVASFTVIASTERDGYEAIRKGIDAFRAVDRIFSMYSSDSEMTTLASNSGGEPVSLSVDARVLLGTAKKLYRDTGGHFDITIEPAMRQWGFRKDAHTEINPPSDKQLKKLEQLIGTDKLFLDNQSALLQKRGMAIDTGGIAGGFALDKAIQAMKKCNIAAAFINFSGDMHCFGEPEKARGWPVQIFNPTTGEPLAKTVELHNEALSTSGAYQNRRQGLENRSWGHLFQPAKACPVEPVASLTAIHSSAMIADAWSTAAYIGARAPKEVKTIVIK